MIAQPVETRNPVFTTEDRNRLTSAGVLFNHKGRAWSFARPCPTCDGYYLLKLHETEPQFIPAAIVARLTSDGLQCMACQRAAQRRTAPSLLRFVPHHTGNGGNGGGGGQGKRRPRQASQGKTPAKLDFSAAVQLAQAYGLTLVRHGRRYELFRGPRSVWHGTTLTEAVEAIRQQRELMA